MLLVRVVSQRELALEQESQLPLVEGTELAYFWVPFSSWASLSSFSPYASPFSSRLSWSCAFWANKSHGPIVEGSAVINLHRKSVALSQFRVNAYPVETLACEALGFLAERA